MRVVVGSTNPVKVDAVREVMLMFYPDAEVSGIKVETGVSKQPFGLEDTVSGRLNGPGRRFCAVTSALGWRQG